MLEAQPLAAGDGARGRVAAEGNLHAVHRNILKNNQVCDGDGYQQIQCPIIAYFLAEAFEAGFLIRDYDPIGFHHKTTSENSIY